MTIRNYTSVIKALTQVADLLDPPLTRRIIASYEVFTDETGKFWGSAGAGGVFLAEDTGRILIQMRSPYVNEPNTWGTFGGAIDSGEDPEKAMRREVVEETGYQGPMSVEMVHLFQDGKFRFYNYLIVVPTEFEPRHGWESSDHVWTSLDELPSPLHFGFKELLPHLKKKLMGEQGVSLQAAVVTANDKALKKKLDQLVKFVADDFFGDLPDDLAKFWKVKEALDDKAMKEAIKYLNKRLNDYISSLGDDLETRTGSMEPKQVKRTQALFEAFKDVQNFVQKLQVAQGEPIKASGGEGPRLTSHLASVLDSFANESGAFRCNAAQAKDLAAAIRTIREDLAEATAEIDQLRSNLNE